MKDRFRSAAVLMACIGILTLAPTGAMTATYSINDLGAPVGAVNVLPNGINAAGSIVADVYFTDSGHCGSLAFCQHAFRYTAANGWQDLTTSLGGHNSFGRRINVAGHVAGYATTTGESETHAIFWTGPGAYSDFGVPSGTNTSHGEAIDDFDRVFGFSGVANQHAFLWPSGADYFPNVGGDWNEFLGALTNVAGSRFFAAGRRAPGGGNPILAFKYDSSGGRTDLGTIGETSYAVDVSIANGNESTQRVVGAIYLAGNWHGALWQPDLSRTDLGINVYPKAINGAGIVVGYKTAGITSTGVVYDSGGGVQNLAPPLVASGSPTIGSAGDVNETGQIAVSLGNGHAGVLSVCGNSVVEAGEQCDLGAANGTATSCCDLYCRFAVGNTCRAGSGGCDAAETCNGSSASCPADGSLPSGTVCRGAVGECDLAETCTGGPTCPADAFKTSGSCTDDGSNCTQDVCNGSGPTCAHPPGNAGAMCGPDDGLPCTIERCDGIHVACQHPAGNTGASCNDGDNNDCTVGQCDGANTFCQAFPKPNGSSCNDQNSCTNGETCQGGFCQGGSTLSCADGVACTLDSCDPATGCQHAPIANCDGASSAEGACGPAGCTITSPNVDVNVPPGCLPQTKSINIAGFSTGTCPAYYDLHGQQTNQLVSCTELLPPNQVFNCPVTLTFKWANSSGCNVLTSNGQISEGRIRLLRNGIPVAPAATLGCGTSSSSSQQCPTEPILSYPCSYSADPTFCAAGSNASCSPGANTWTVQALKFSEYAVAQTCEDTGLAKMTLGHMNVAGRGKLSLRGAFGLVGSTPPDVDPAANGVELTLHDGDATALHAVLPGGALWTVSGDGRKWTYRNKAIDAPGSIHRVVINLGSKKPSFLFSGSDGTYSASTALSAEMYFPGSDVCAIARFEDYGCLLKGSPSNQTVQCR